MGVTERTTRRKDKERFNGKYIEAIGLEGGVTERTGKRKDKYRFNGKYIEAKGLEGEVNGRDSMDGTFQLPPDFRIQISFRRR